VVFDIVWEVAPSGALDHFVAALPHAWEAHVCWDASNARWKLILHKPDGSVLTLGGSYETRQAAQQALTIVLTRLGPQMEGSAT